MTTFDCVPRAHCGHMHNNGVNRRVLLLDPHPLRLEALSAVAERVGLEVVDKTTTEVDALDALERHQPDLLVLSLSRPEVAHQATAIVERARDRVPGIRVIVAGETTDPAVVGPVLASGVAAYIVGSARVEDLAVAMRQAFEPSVFTHAAGPKAPDVDRAAEVGLTRRELEVLRLVAAGRSNAEVAARLGMTLPTVKFHLAGIFRKLGVANRTAATDWALRHGVV